jgi:predicted amidohydrolase
MCPTGFARTILPDVDTFPSMDRLRLGLVQYAPAWCDPAASLERFLELLREAPDTDLLVLPEMSLTGFTMDAAKAVLLPAVRERLSAIARERKTGIVYGSVEEGCNRIVLLDRRGARAGAYDKRHLFSLGDESRHYAPGSDVLDWTFEDWTIRPSICYDLRFPYHFWKGAERCDLALVPACWPGSRERHWKTLLAARAIENQMWVAGANRVGDEPRLSYTGASMVLDPRGTPVLEAGNAEGIHVVEIDRTAVSDARSRYPFLLDRIGS